VGSVSAKELEHYQRVREQFEMAEKRGRKGRGKLSDRRRWERRKMLQQ